MIDHIRKLVVATRECCDPSSITDHPEPGEYVITGPQAGNLHGEHGWAPYLGYVAQIRKEAGALGTDKILLRHPDGQLICHENQVYFRLDDYWRERAKSVFPEGMTPDEYEDYSVPYTVNGAFPARGRVIDPDTGSGPSGECS